MKYQTLIAKTREGLYAVAGDNWHVLESTVQEFQELSCDDDLSFGSIGGVAVAGHGWVALAKPASSSA